MRQQLVDDDVVDARVFGVGVAEEGVNGCFGSELAGAEEGLDGGFAEGFADAGEEEGGVDLGCGAAWFDPGVGSLEMHDAVSAYDYSDLVDPVLCMKDCMMLSMFEIARGDFFQTCADATDDAPCAG